MFICKCGLIKMKYLNLPVSLMSSCKLYTEIGRMNKDTSPAS